MTGARLLTIMGSGETSPTMAKVHRELIARLGDDPVGVVLDTPFGFQENADDIVARAQAYFAESVGTPLRLASLRSAAAADRLAVAAFVEAVQAASYVFSGPGSPSYALRQWRDGPLPGLLAAKLREGGAVTFASAAALTLGVATVPVYEIYKAGEAPAWLPGLDLLAEAGLRAAVIPHYNNAEGGNHDTRYCYLGETRLARMEAELPEGAFILGVDEHTGLILDLGAGSATVVGLGNVTVRAGGRSAALQAGTCLAIGDLAGLAGSAGAVEVAVAELPAAEVGARSSFRSALAAGDMEAAVRAVLAVDDLEQVRAMVVSLGRLAAVGARDPREVVGPFVEALLDQRTQARADRRFGDADLVRDRLAALGVEVRDTPGGTEWLLTAGPVGPPGEVPG